MSMLRTMLLAGGVAALLGLTGCGEGPAAPLSPAEHPLGTISDARHGNGNPHFYLLPPLVEKAKAGGTFNPRLHPVVEVQVENGAGWSTLRTFTRSAGTVQVSAQDQLYQADWNTGQDPIDLQKTYRIRVRVLELELGHADVKFAATGKGAQALQSGTTVGAVAGRTLPVKFRIEEGALREALALSGQCADCVEATVARGTAEDVVTPSGYAAAHFFAGSIPASVGEVTVLIARVSTSTQPCLPTALTTLQQAEGCYRYETDPVLQNGFDQPVRVEVCLDPNRSVDEYQLHKFSTTGPQAGQVVALPRVAASLIDCTGFALSGPPQGPLLALARTGLGKLAEWLGPQSAYATDIRWGGMSISFSRIGFARPLTVAATGGDGQTGTPGGTLPSPLTVRVMAGDGVPGHTPVPAAGVPVSFQVTGGGGSLGSATALTDANGYASTTWTLGSALGAQTLSATVPGGASATFGATAQDSIITFEEYPGGAPACAYCPVTNEFAGRGVVFSFTPQVTSVTASHAQLFDSSYGDPQAAPGNHSVTAAGIPLSSGGGFHSGTVHLHLSPAPLLTAVLYPKTVRFRLRGNDAVTLYPVSFVDGAGATVAQPTARTVVGTYTAGAGFTGREEVITLYSQSGIQRVDVQMNGFITLIDNLVVKP